MSDLLKPIKTDKEEGFIQKLISFFGRTLISVSIPLITFIVLYIGFIFLRDSGAPQMVITITAIIWGVGGVASLFFSLNWFIKRLSLKWKQRFVPFLRLRKHHIILWFPRSSF